MPCIENATDALHRGNLEEGICRVLDRIRGYATQLPVCLVAWLVMPLKRLVDPEFKTGACGERIIEKSDLVGVSQILQFRLADFGGVTQESSVEEIRGKQRPFGISPEAEDRRHYGRQHVVIENISVAHDIEVINVPLGWHGKSSIACGGYRSEE